MKLEAVKVGMCLRDPPPPYFIITDYSVIFTSTLIYFNPA